MEKDLFTIDKINNVRDEQYGMWQLSVQHPHVAGKGISIERIYVSKSRKECIEYAKANNIDAYISSGHSHGCKW